MGTLRGSSGEIGGCDLFLGPDAAVFPVGPKNSSVRARDKGPSSPIHGGWWRRGDHRHPFEGLLLRIVGHADTCWYEPVLPGLGHLEFSEKQVNPRC